MGNPAHILGDLNTGGGAMVGPQQDFVYVQGKLVSVDGSAVTAHDPHPPTLTANGASFSRINGIPINRQGDADVCGHPRAGSPSHLFIGG